jgi:hypothetical protein
VPSHLAFRGKRTGSRFSAAIMMPEFEEQIGAKFERAAEPTGQYLQPPTCQIR